MTTKFLIIFLLLFAIVGCSPKTEAPILNNIEVRTIETTKPAPIVPSVDQLSLRDVQWIIVTPENIEVVFEKIKSEGSETAIFALSAKGYENLSLNINDIRSIVQQQQKIIAIYKKQFDK